MKKILWSLLLLIITIPALCQEANEYRVYADQPHGDTCESVVLAVSGLKLRTKPDFQAKAITTIPFGEKIQYACVNYEFENIKVVVDKDSVSGVWLSVIWQDHKGYVFSGYLGQGILKMNQPFYLLTESGAWCWDDAYISPDYNYYGAFPDKDTTSFLIKKIKPLFFNGLSNQMGGISFSFRQKQISYFAFASKDSFPEGKMHITKSKQQIDTYWSMPRTVPNQKISIPNTDWELKTKQESIKESEGSSYNINRLIIKDNQTGTWQYLLDQKVFFDTIQLNWSGDLDGDGIQDFMISYSSEHSGGMMLFLSKNHKKWEIIHLAGAYIYQDCC